MKLKHNKKRNTAFLYEALVKELTKAVVNKDTQKKNALVSMLKENFSVGKILQKELELIKTLSETKTSESRCIVILFPTTSTLLLFRNCLRKTLP